MEATELRINNYYQAKSPEKTQWQTNYRLCNFGMQQALNNEINLRPIPMTNNLLEEFGFKGWGSNGEYLFDMDDFWVVTWFSDTNRFIIDAIEVEFKYLHQLQTLYYVLTGNELKRAEKIKEKASTH